MEQTARKSKQEGKANPEMELLSQLFEGFSSTYTFDCTKNINETIVEFMVAVVENSAEVPMEIKNGIHILNETRKLFQHPKVVESIQADEAKRFPMKPNRKINNPKIV